MIESLRTFRSLREILKTNFIEQGRKVKETAGGMFYDPAALVAFIRFNFLLRRTLIELMHADLIAIRAGLGQLQASGARIIDCHHLGLSATEPLSKISSIADEWKQPFQKEYTERSVSQAFDKLLGLRTDVELALEKAIGKAGDAAPLQPAGQGTKPAAGSKKSVAPPPAPSASGKTKERQAAPAAPAAAQPDSAVVLDFENCMEQIWEQLIATPPSRGRSMTTVKIGGARILMSSWEVTAFVSEDGPSAEDLRRAVVARVLVTAAMESAKETGKCHIARSRDEHGPRGSDAIAGTRGRGQASQGHRSGGKPRDQHEASALGVGRSRKTVADGELARLSRIEISGSWFSLRNANVVILTDETEFARLLTACWQAERLAPNITVAQ